jgi:purine-nucleoside phosphorylase
MVRRHAAAHGFRILNFSADIQTTAGSAAAISEIFTGETDKASDGNFNREFRRLKKATKAPGRHQRLTVSLAVVSGFWEEEPMTAEFTSLPESLEAFGAKAAIVLGSGLNALAEALEVEATIPYESIPGLPVSRVPGHAGAFALARFHGHPLLLCRGRVHLYEGWSARDVTASIRLLHRIGVTRLVLTNASGTVNPDFPPGEWMMLADHLNLTGTTPLLGGPNFIDLTEAYSMRLREIFRRAATEAGVPLHSGVYAGFLGPQYETPAEVRMARVLGADAVGMSTVLETIQARALGLEVAGFSCLTNWGAGISGEILSHEEVTTTGRGAAAALIEILQRALPQILA